MFWYCSAYSTQQSGRVRSCFAAQKMGVAHRFCSDASPCLFSAWLRRVKGDHNERKDTTTGERSIGSKTLFKGSVGKMHRVVRNVLDPGRLDKNGHISFPQYRNRVPPFVEWKKTELNNQPTLGTYVCSLILLVTVLFCLFTAKARDELYLLKQ